MGTSQPTTKLGMSLRSRDVRRTCPPCGRPLMLLASPGSLRRFCSPACRQAALAVAEAELAHKEAARPPGLGPAERNALLRLGGDLKAVWHAPTTTDRDRKELLRALLEEVMVDVDRDQAVARLTLRWRGGAVSELRVTLKRKPPAIRTDEDTISLIRRLARHHPDTVITGILNRQGRLSATGQRFTATMVASLRGYWRIPRYQPRPGRRKARRCPSTKRRESSAWSPPRSISGSTRASSQPSRTRGAVVDQDHRRAASTVRRSRRAGWPCWRPPWPSGSPARRCCSVSSGRAASCGRPVRTAKRLANQGSSPPTDTVRPRLIDTGGSMNRTPR
jgi:hypothetical protein